MRDLRICMAAWFAFAASAAIGGDLKIEATEVPGENKVEIAIGGRHFTTYCYGEEFADKPIFFPVLSPEGTPVNRFYGAAAKREGENTDHPHHQSMWFTYGELNGVDYWNREDSGRRIQHREIAVTAQGLNITLDWIDPTGVKVLSEEKNVTFGGAEDVLWMDHEITLTANETDAHFGDTKEGAFGMRVAGSLREKDRTGHYINAEGLETSRQVWGKESAWVALRGVVTGESGEEEVTIAIFSHPSSLNHPPRWHARDYGLFTANPIGQKGYDRTADERELLLKKGESVRLLYRLAVYSGKVDKQRLDADYEAFSR